MKLTLGSPRRYELEPHEASAVQQFLWGNLSSRELGKRLGLSHQQALNLISSLCRQWITDEILVFTQGYGLLNAKEVKE